ncbi:hypothetical protein MHTCC0001_23040 [Flavobacteriaceae bacterium MHTCC 0001]
MSKDVQQPQQSEEVDLGQLFKLIGKGFNNFFRFIGNSLNKLFLVFVWFVFFIKKHIIKIAVAVVLGYGFGYYKEKRDESIFKSTTIIKQNYKTGENLYGAIQYYNQLIAEQDFITLSKAIGISADKAAAVLSLEVESVFTENEQLEFFDEYVKAFDTIALKKVSFENFIKNIEDFEYPFQKITIKAREKGVFGKIINEIANEISSTEFFINEQKKDLEELSRLENSLTKSIEESKALQNVYKNVLEKPLLNQGSQTSISIDNTEDKSITKEYELYLNDIELKRELVEIQREILDKNKIIEIVSNKESLGIIDNSKSLFGLQMGAKMYYAALLTLTAIFILLGLNFMKFLERYRDKI